MLESLDQTITAEMVRLVELDRELSLEDAANRVLYLADGEGVQGLAGRVEQVRGTLGRHGILNPEWLEANGLGVHFFLSNARPGFLDQVVHALETDRVGVSQYALYGDWDSLIVLYGTAREAETLYSNLRSGTDDTVHFSAAEILVAYRHIVKPYTDMPGKIDNESMNALAVNYDDPALAGQRDEFLRTGYILGPAWAAKGETPYPVVAYIGILVRGRGGMEPKELRAALLGSDVLQETLMHLLRISGGLPYHYFAKLACKSMAELDAATNALGFMKIGDVRLEGRTLVVADGIDRFPAVRRANVSGLAVGPDFEGIMRAATTVYEGLGGDERKAFNALNDNEQVAVVKAVAELRQKAAEGAWDAETGGRIRSALATFSRECVSPSGDGNFTGAVGEITAAVEGLTKRFTSRIAYAVYGKDLAAMQRELRLPTSKFRNLSLGKAAQALQVASSHPDFAQYADQLSDRWIERLDQFADSRNRWAHDDVDLKGPDLLDEVHRVLAEGLALIGWLSQSINNVHQQSAEEQEENPPAAELTLSEHPGRGLSVFVSHASADARIASRVAMGLKFYEYETWYDEWELLPGDSIVERVEAAISTTDVLLVLLSRNSVDSQWVRRELSAGLARQLSGSGVLVIPVILDDCEVPGMLRGTKYVDLRGDFERGFKKLADALAARRGRGVDGA